MGEKWQNMPLQGKTREWYRCQKLVLPVPICRGKIVLIQIKVVSVPLTKTGLVPVPIQVVPVPLLPTTLIFWYSYIVKLIFVHRLFRDPNRGLTGVQIRMKLSEKSAKRYSLSVNSASLINVICVIF